MISIQVDNVTKDTVARIHKEALARFQRYPPSKETQEIFWLTCLIDRMIVKIEQTAADEIEAIAQMVEDKNFAVEQKDFDETWYMAAPIVDLEKTLKNLATAIRARKAQKKHEEITHYLLPSRKARRG